MGGCSIGGFRPDGRRFLLMNIFGGGWGGRPREDGESASVSICQGDVRSAPIELQEILVSVFDRAFRVAHRFRRRGLSPRRPRRRNDVSGVAALVANVNCERTKNPPWGLNGGKPGAVNEATLIRRDGSEHKLKKATGVRMEAGDRMTFLTAGGGGWGDPKTRARSACRGRRARRLRVGGSSAARLRRSHAGAKRSGGVGAARNGKHQTNARRRTSSTPRCGDAERPASITCCSTATPGRAIICATVPISASLKATDSLWSMPTARSICFSTARRTRNAPNWKRRASRVILPPTSSRAAGARLDRVANARLAAAPRHFMPQWLADPARGFRLDDATALVDSC